MFAVYAKEANYNDPLASVIVGERPEPIMPEGWVRVRVTHASLNRHDIFTLLGVTAQKEPIPFPMILGNDGAGLLDDGTPVVICPLIGSDSWRGAETLDPAWHVFSELVPGTMADYVAVPRRNAIPMPEAIIGRAWQPSTTRSAAAVMPRCASAATATAAPCAPSPTACCRWPAPCSQTLFDPTYEVREAAGA